MKNMDEVRKLINDLRTESEQLADTLIQTGTQLKDEGILPPDHLSGKIEHFRSSVDQLLNLILLECHNEEKTFRTLQEIFDFAEEKIHAQNLKREYEKWLRMCLNIKSTSPADEAVLSDLYSRVQLLINDMENHDFYEKNYLKEIEPYMALVRMLHEGQSLADDEWLKFEELVRGRLNEKIAAALLRKRLYLEPPSLEHSSQEERHTDQIAAAFLSEADVDEVPLTRIEPEENRVAVQTEEKEVKEEKEQKEETIPEEKIPETITADQTQTQSEFPSEKIDSDAAGEPHASEWERLLWKWMQENRLSQAYRLAEHLYGQSEDDRRVLPDLIQATLLAQYIRFDVGEIANRLKGMFESWLSGGFAEKFKDHVYGLLMAAAALRPAILAPGTNALQILQKINFRGRMYNFIDHVKDFASHYIPLDPYVLHNLKTEAAWKEEQAKLRRDTEQAIRKLSSSTILFQAASKVWMKWMEPQGWVHFWLDCILQNRTEKVEEARTFLDKYMDPNEFRSRVHYTDRFELGRQSGKDITARALQQLRSNFDEAMELVREWIRLVNSQPGHSNEYHQQIAKRLEKGIRPRYEEVIGELREQAASAGEASAKSAFVLLEWAVREVFALFDPNTPVPNKEPKADFILNHPLLKIPAIGIRSDWTLYDAAGGFPVEELVRTMEDGLPSFEEAFNARLDRRDVEGCRLMLETAGDEELLTLGLNRDKLEERLDIRLKEYRDSLRHSIRDAVKQIETAFTHNLIDDHKRNKYLTELEPLERSIDEILYFPEALGKLEQLRSDLERERNEARERMKRRFREAGVTESHPHYDQIKKILETGNLYTAEELLSRIQNNEEIVFETLSSKEQEREPFREFFDPDATVFQELIKTLNSTDLSRIINMIKDGKNVGPLDMGQLPSAQRRQAAEMLEAWRRAKKSSSRTVVEERDIRVILNNIGLSVKSVDRTPTSKTSRDYQIIKTEVLSDPNRCPVPFYGSQAKGHYRLVAFWDRLSPEDMLNEISNIGDGHLPAIVFFFGRLSAQNRRELARLCRERRRTFIVLDEVLLLYLCGERGSRLPVFFKLALPFTYLEPYQTTASLLPSEMFFGRKAELQAIMEGRSGLVYGGRQLGKTVLLREAERRFHSPGDGRLAVWIDLKAEGIGLNKSIDEIWNVIARELNRVGLSEIKPNVNSADKLFQQIQDWLDKDWRRRILLLLDEADRFLEMDAKDYGISADERNRSGNGFIRCSKIKGFMEKTNKRFHVVFAGLHNVQRSFKNQNDPLAHLGQAICVGPLMSKGEWKDAYELITKPLAALGYFFETPDLVLQILSQTNYYPSLIQLYCHQLLRHLLDHRSLMSFSAKTPPYIITARQVDEAYQDRELQQAIKHRFNLTLQLDPRYKVIAHVIALESLGDDDVPKNGIPVKEILRHSVDYWSKGFSNMAMDSFRVLLDEMVDLGVLRRVREGYYCLRSPNLVSLMGTKNEIEEELLRTDRVILTEYDAAHFRPSYRVEGVPPNSRRSPLTAEQESELMQSPKRVSIIFGHQAAGIGEVKEYLRDRQDAGQFQLRVISGVMEKSAFLRQLREMGETRADKVFILVDFDCPWTTEWVKEIREFLDSSKRYDKLYVIFLADAEHTLALARQNPDFVDDLLEAGILILQLKPWHPSTVGLWLSDCEFENTRPVIEKIENATGNWSSLLYRLYDKARKNPHQLQHFIQEFETNILEKDLMDVILSEFGASRDEVKSVLQYVALGDVHFQEIADTLKIPAEMVRSILVCAEILGTARQAGKGIWKADPLVAKLVLEAGDSI